MINPETVEWTAMMKLSQRNDGLPSAYQAGTRICNPVALASALLVTATNINAPAHGDDWLADLTFAAPSNAHLHETATHTSRASAWQDTITDPASGTPTDDDAQAEHRESSFVVRAGVAFTHQFTADLNAGNHDFSVNRFAAGFSLRNQLSEGASLTFALAYHLDDYNFGGSTGFFAGDPWGEVHTIDFSVIYGTQLTEQFGIFGGPVVQSSRESGADFGDSIVAGGVIGATWATSQDLVIGAGIGVVSQLEDSVRVFPSLRVHWQLNDRLSLGTAQLPQFAAPAMAELGYRLNDHWRFSLAGGYRFRRFRLDDNGPVPNGIGEDRSLPIYFTAQWTPSPNVQLGGRIGLAFDGRLRAESSNGTLITRHGHDTPLVIGVWGAINF